MSQNSTPPTPNASPAPAPPPSVASATPRLLDREMPEDYRQQWTEHIAQPVQIAVRGSESVVVFRIEQEWLALPASVFHGVIHHAPIHSLPHRDRTLIHGVMHVRGDLLVCVSLLALMGMTSNASEPSASVGERSGRVIVVATPRGQLAIPVDEVAGIHRYAPDALLEPPATLARAGTRYTIGLVEYQGRTVARLDEGVLFAAIDRALS